MMNDGSPESFYKSVMNWEKITWGRVNKVVKGISADLFFSIVKGTPVDSGRAKSNWVFSLDKPELNGGKVLKSGKYTAKAKRAPEVIKNKVLRAKNPIDKKQHVHKYYLTNTTPYIGMLEYGLYPSPSKSGKTVGGFSSQAVGGFMRKNIQRFKNIRITKYAQK